MNIERVPAVIPAASERPFEIDWWPNRVFFKSGAVDRLGSVLEQAGRRRFLRSVAASLPTRQREAVEQLALAGKSLVEAAAATGQSHGALTVNLHRALNALRARFGERNLANATV